jgi:hypothetical protein
MTDQDEPQQQPQREHCDHECVCMGYVQRAECYYEEDDQCRNSKCKHDTRSRPHPPAPETLGDLIAKTNAGSLQAMIDEQCKEASRAATLATLDMLESWAKPKRDGWCNNDCNRDPFEEMLKKIDALRAQSTTAEKQEGQR